VPNPALGKIPADQAVGVLIGRPLPGVVRISEIGVDLDALSQNLVASHLPALIAGQRLLHAERGMAEFARETFQSSLDRAATQLDQHQVTAPALDQEGAHRTLVARALDVVAFPVPRYEAGRHLNGHV